MILTGEDLSAHWGKLPNSLVELKLACHPVWKKVSVSAMQIAIVLRFRVDFFLY